jgi:hypothetical protein
MRIVLWKAAKPQVRWFCCRNTGVWEGGQFSGASRGLQMLLGPDVGNGGQGGIRTPGGLAPSPVFKTGAINRSATCPTKLPLAG